MISIFLISRLKPLDKEKAVPEPVEELGDEEGSKEDIDGSKGETKDDSTHVIDLMIIFSLSLRDFRQYRYPCLNCDVLLLYITTLIKVPYKLFARIDILLSSIFGLNHPKTLKLYLFEFPLQRAFLKRTKVTSSRRI